MQRITQYRGFGIVHTQTGSDTNIAVVDGAREIGPLWPSVESAKLGIDNYVMNGQFE